MNTKLICTMVLAAATMGTVLHAQAYSDSDKAFLDKASQGNVAEVELGKLAEAKSDNARVKAFGAKMVHDHTMLAEKMKLYVEQAGLHPGDSLNSEHQALYDKLNGLSGEEFNKEYVAAMDKAHHEDLQMFKDEIASTHNPRLKMAVESGEKVIVQHVEIIDGIDKKMGMTPAGE
jgi:putative membrane protein